MEHAVSSEDRDFLTAFEAFQVSPDAFDHAAHVRLAYIYLCEQAVDAAAVRMKDALLGFLTHLGVDHGKYHETVTRAWIMAVAHFMSESVPCESASAFMTHNPSLLDRKLMLSHYSAEVLFSPEARQAFVQPDVQPIPEQPTGDAETPAHVHSWRPGMVDHPNPAPGLNQLVRSNELRWKPLDEPGVSGVSVKVLRFDAAAGRAPTILLRFDPGATYPAHTHPGGEEIYVLEGDIQLGRDRLRAGDFLFTAPHNAHAVRSEGGCVILVVVPEEVEKLSRPE